MTADLLPLRLLLLTLAGWVNRHQQHVRLFYMFRGVRTAVLLDGMMKKRDDIPDDMVKRLRRMQRALRARK